MDNLRRNLQKHPAIAWVAILGYIAFNGCFVFPFGNQLFPFDLSKAMLVFSCYLIIGLCFAALLSKGKGFLVFILSLGFTAIGMGLRYLLEYGEVSNTMNFTPSNIAMFLIFIPLYCTLVYWAICKTIQ